MSTYRDSIARVLCQAHDLTFQQIERIIASEAGVPSGRRRQRIADLLPKRIPATNTEKWLSENIPGPVRRKSSFVGSLPVHDDAARFGPICTNEKWPYTVSKVARFLEGQWIANFDRARKRMEVFCHPTSLFYDVDAEYRGRSELGVVAVQLGELLRHLYESPRPEVRAIAQAFRRTPGGYPSRNDRRRIRWDDYGPKEIEYYEPEGRFQIGNVATFICLPMAFYWDGATAIETWLHAFKERFTDQQYSLWGPGLCSMEHLK